jgi:hypothetical protein
MNRYEISMASDDELYARLDFLEGENYQEEYDMICEELEARQSDREAYDFEDDGMSDVEADADTLKSCGWGTDEDYGYFGDNDDYESMLGGPDGE